ncbi:acyltransferase [Hahella sp. KA22]|uniref:acyltransferase n=1 Tax=Hahella sp. KA22 TaxID=1628392 RepID=UPI000FDDDDCB|nr:acyltransferase [Hahella sp. KA22]AZZ91676.1 acyltransferase [Hahella sp. KA22]QAY55046.1 acyltransferase [Hahella sp. KA22]
MQWKSYLNGVWNKVRYFRSDVQISPSTRVPLNCKVKANQGGHIYIGRNCELHSYSMILSYGGSIYIGDNCSLNPFSILYGHGGLRIGTGVRIAAHVVVIPANHTPGDESTPLYKKEVFTKGIEIGDYSWLGAGCKVLDGVKIGKHAIIGAGSVVNTDIPDYAVAVGVPARVISSSKTTPSAIASAF